MRDHVRTLHYLLGYTTLRGMILLSGAYTYARVLAREDTTNALEDSSRIARGRPCVSGSPFAQVATAAAGKLVHVMAIIRALRFQEPFYFPIGRSREANPLLRTDLRRVFLGAMLLASELVVSKRIDLLCEFHARRNCHREFQVGRRYKHFVC